jgi:prepilin-type N-terminal cleavage/methylation domain-containing protein
MRTPADPGQRGYTLIEALVAVAIIGLITLVTVPNFISMYRSARVKSAVNNLITDIRALRQEAVTTYRPMMLSIGTTTAEQGLYWIYQWDGSAWVVVPTVMGDARSIETEPGATPMVYFAASGFLDLVTADGANRKDVIFETNGALRSPLSADPTITVQSTLDVPKPQYTITINPSGTLKVE